MAEKEFKEQFQFFNDTVFQQGLADVFNNKAQIDMVAAQQHLNEYSSKMRDTEINKNIAEGDVYLKENGAREGVVTLDNGLQYEVLKGMESVAKEARKEAHKARSHSQKNRGNFFDKIMKGFFEENID